MAKPHILALPSPAQGHVIPLMELSQRLVSHGFKVTFVNTEHNHRRIMNAMSETSPEDDRIRLVSIPDGLEPWEDRNDPGRIMEASRSVMCEKLEELITKINEVEDDKITCIIADAVLGGALEVAERMKIRRVAFWPASAAFFASIFSIPKLIENGVIDNNGVPQRSQIIELAPEMPTVKTENLLWACFSDTNTQRIMFHAISRNNQSVKLADWILCNSSSDLEPAAFTLAPEILPIGPMLASSRLGNSASNFWAEDTTCLKWLDQQPPSSVIYIAFGSFTVFDQFQFHELALGLELAKRPFLWVVRQDIGGNSTTHAYPEGFLERIGSQGKIVSWAPQQKVLGHPSVACFLSHCGWNSTIEGVSNGIPFLCWPNFGDQFFDESYVCDVWKVGLRFSRNESGIIERGEIKSKVDQLLGDEMFKGRALKLKELATNSVTEGGQSNVVFKNFVEWVWVRS